MIPDWIFLRRTLLLDANLLVIIAIGLTDETLLDGNLLGNYAAEDFDLITNIVRVSERAIVTPYILTEVNGLLNKTGFAREACRTTLCEGIIPIFEERYNASRELATNAKIIRQFGLTDASIVEAALDDTFVLTADGPLCGYLRGNGKAAWHYDEIRHIAKSLRR